MHDPAGTAMGTAAGGGAHGTMKRGYTGDEITGDEKMYPGRGRAARPRWLNEGDG